ncbi:NAD-binding protein [Lactarius quietus]|nr:NAD-binding protein [Lactarius quietus]
MLVLSAEDVSRVTASFNTEHLQSIVARAFVSHSHDDLVSPHRTAVDMPEHRALFMPARIPNVGTTVKVVSVPSLPDDTRGITGSTLVLDEKTGATKALINARSVLATTLLHPPESAEFHHLVVFGAGLQTSAHIRQLLATYPFIARITIVNRTLSARLSALLGELHRAHIGPACVGLSSTDRALTESVVREADIICCATPSTEPLFPSEWMAEVDSALIRRARAVLVDSRSACAFEAGELIAAGVPPARMVEVGELIRRVHAPALAGVCDDAWAWEPDTLKLAAVLATGSGDVTIFKSVGIGAQDVAIAVATVERAKEMGIGTTVPNFE